MDEIFDATILDSLYEAIGDGVTRIVSVYVDDFPNNIQVMRKALVSLEYEVVGRIAHSLKSSSANLGAMQIYNLALALEKEINQGLTEEVQIAAAINELEQAFQRVQPKLISYIR